MSVTQQALAVGRGLAAPRTWRHAWFGGLHGADYIWAIAFALPYIAIFLFFVIYPIAFGIWMGSDIALYEQLFSDPRYLTAVLNTMLYVVIGVNLKMFLAFMLSGFFFRKGWWVKGLMVIFILPWATPALACLHVDPLVPERPVGDVEQHPLRAVRHRWAGLPERALVRASQQHRRLYLEDPAVLDGDPARRPDGGAAGTLRGRRRRWRLAWASSRMLRCR